MATVRHMDELVEQFTKFSNLDKDKFLRPNLGDASLQRELKPIIDDINRKVDRVLKMAINRVSAQAFTELKTAIEEIVRIMDEHSKRKEAEYVSQNQRVLSEFNGKYEQILAVWPNFIAAEVESSGILQGDYQKFTDDLAKHSAKILEQAEKQAQRIEASARQTAAKVSIKEAQEQFGEARKHHRNQAIIWSAISVLILLGFFMIIFNFYNAQFIVSEQFQLQALYHTILRLTILTGIGAIATFCLRILRAHMHMHQHSLHRLRLANSMASFVEAAATPEQRDLILAHLVEAIATFGNSGILQKGDDSIPIQRMIVDNFTRGFTSSQKSS
jgi:hypothetical protein